MIHSYNDENAPHLHRKLRFRRVVSGPRSEGVLGKPIKKFHGPSRSQSKAVLWAHKRESRRGKNCNYHVRTRAKLTVRKRKEKDRKGQESGPYRVRGQNVTSMKVTKRPSMDPVNY